MQFADGQKSLFITILLIQSSKLFAGWNMIKEETDTSSFELYSAT